MTSARGPRTGRARQPRRCGATTASVLILTIGFATCAAPGAAAQTSSDNAVRLERVRQQIQRLEGELGALKSRERGVLGEIEELDAELRLREAEFAEATLRLSNLNSQVETSTARLEDLRSSQDRRGEYLAARLRQLYRAGPRQALRGFLGGREADAYWSGLRYASLLSERDGRVLDEFYDTAERLEAEHAELALNQTALAATSADLEQARDAIAGSRRRRARALSGIRDDAKRRQSALDELQAAAERLTSVVDGLQQDQGDVLDVRRFRGLLDWPAEGQVTAGFGTVIHPRFKTRVPHPGLDIEGDAGADIKSVFEGEVVFASWMRGYGLTAIVDHGSSMLSIYAHASVLLVEPGERVVAGQILGQIGDTGSLRGPYLYFELRVGGSAVEPTAWLRPRR